MQTISSGLRHSKQLLQCLQFGNSVNLFTSILSSVTNALQPMRLILCCFTNVHKTADKAEEKHKGESGVVSTYGLFTSFLHACAGHKNRIA